MIELLTNMLAGNLSPNETLESWPEENNGDDKLMRNAWHSLYHYVTDEDIRSKEPSYAMRQREALKDIVTELEKSLK